MSKDDKSRSGSGALVAAVIVAVLPLLYALSVGPAAWMFEHGFISEDQAASVEHFYIPLLWVCERLPALRRALRVYVSLFTGRWED